MPIQNADLHGNAPDKPAVALLVIDMINDLDFPGGDELLRPALPMARQIADLMRRASDAGVPVISVNDNFGRCAQRLRRRQHGRRESDGSHCSRSAAGFLSKG